MRKKCESKKEIRLEHFLHDFVWLIKDVYNKSLDQIDDANMDVAKAFAEGESLAYHHVLQTIENQLSAFGASDEICDGIAPEPGQKAEFRKIKS